jgi:hypothetical protein
VVSVGCWAITHLDSLAFPLAVELLCLCTPSFGQLSWRLLVHAEGLSTHKWHAGAVAPFA